MDVILLGHRELRPALFPHRHRRKSKHLNNQHSAPTRQLRSGPQHTPSASPRRGYHLAIVRLQ